jgi:hypothetical protein
LEAKRRKHYAVRDGIVTMVRMGDDEKCSVHTSTCKNKYLSVRLAAHRPQKTPEAEVIQSIIVEGGGVQHEIARVAVRVISRG